MTTIEKTEQIPFWVTREEADALLQILLHAAPSAMVREEIAEQLLHRIAETNRAFDREANIAEARGSGESSVVPFVPATKNVARMDDDSSRQNPRNRTNQIRPISTAARGSVRLR